ncbi:MAG TPA: hypothetical protein VN083_02410 [Vicinamibacteria bacterium]|nr:hypothetical protein [Vicinamibacteria bacterium]
MKPGLGALALLGLLALPAGAVLWGSSSPLGVTFRLGPGDSPFLVGFSPEFEIEGGVATHWTGENGTVDLPLEAEGNAVLSYRLARVLPQTAHVEVLLDGEVVDRFSCRGGAFLERSVPLGGRPRTPLSLTFHVESKDSRKLGVKLHWVRLEGAKGARLWLRGLRPETEGTFLVLVFAVLLLASGWHSAAAAALVGPVSVLVSLGLRWDPWLTHRLLTLLPETLLVVGLPSVGLGRLLLARGRVGIRDLRVATLLVALTFLARGAALNHPDFYYPDFMLHARLVQVVREAGVDFLRSPSRYLWARARGVPPEAGGLVRAASGLWMRPFNGAPLGMPYSLAFHLPFALLPLGYDSILTAIRVAGALISTLPLLAAFVFARRAGISAFGVVLMAVVPSYVSKLSVGALPAIFGHAVDMAFLAWLAGRVGELSRPRVFAVGVALVAACDLAYVSAVIHLSLFLALLGLVLALEAPMGARFRALVVPLALGAGGTLVAVALYYRDFLGAVWVLATGWAQPTAGGASPYPPEPFLPLLAFRTLSFFGWGYPLLALAGLALLLGRRRAGLLLPWMLTYVLLLFLRAHVPDVFRWVHDTLFVTPALCLASGVAIAFLFQAGGLKRLLAVGLLVAFGLQGLVLQWLAVSDEFGRVL